MNEKTDVDILVVGAGLSGICAGHYLKEGCPEKTFAILEARSDLGGTWDLFGYPGIRSDSDMHTLGFSFRPWPKPRAIADGPSILRYLHETVEEEGLARHIRYRHGVTKVCWSSQAARWTVHVEDPAGGGARELTCRWLWSCTGYYRYDRGHMPEFEGVERFEGQLIHPQFWPASMECRDKRVVVIGSGATAVTLVPELADSARHVTMLQRSPGYILSVPGEDRVSGWLKRALGERLGAGLTRWKNILRLIFFYQFCRRMPKTARAYLIERVREAIGDVVDVDEHFSPSYDPWDQRVCFVPDGDLFEALRAGRASVVTDHIASFTEEGLALRSGEHLEADVVVSATGLELLVAGGATIEVDGEEVNPGSRVMYKGAMLSGVPNAIMSVGYTNASWTLKCELISQWAVRLLKEMDAGGHRMCVARRQEAQGGEEPLIDFESGYVLRALDDLPAQGSKRPWRLYQNYLLDSLLFRVAPVRDSALHFE